MSLKIAFILENFYPKIGGIETLFKHLCEALVREGHEVLVITSNCQGCPRNQTLKGIQIIRTTRGDRKLFFFQSISYILRHCRYVDLIHTTTYTAGFPAFIGAKLLKKKIIITFHEYRGRYWFTFPYSNRFNSFIRYVLEQFIIRIPFDKVVAVSNFTKNALQKAGVSPVKIAMIYNGIDYKKFENFQWKLSEQIDTFSYSFLGRLARSKGLHLLLPAILKVKEQFPHIRFKFFISEPQKKVYQQFHAWIDKYDLENTIEIKMNLSDDDLRNELMSTNCIVIPSSAEGFCYSAVESMAMNIPVISSGRWALKEVIGGKYLEMEKYNVENLVKVLIKAYSGDWIVMQSKHFHLVDTVQNYLDLYKSL